MTSKDALPPAPSSRIWGSTARQRPWSVPAGAVAPSSRSPERFCCAVCALEPACSAPGWLRRGASCWACPWQWAEGGEGGWAARRKCLKEEWWEGRCWRVERADGCGHWSEPRSVGSSVQEMEEGESK